MAQHPVYLVLEGKTRLACLRPGFLREVTLGFPQRLGFLHTNFSPSSAQGPSAASVCLPSPESCLDLPESDDPTPSSRQTVGAQSPSPGLLLPVLPSSPSELPSGPESQVCDFHPPSILFPSLFPISFSSAHMFCLSVCLSVCWR